jgi:hypothetical protein
LTWTIHSRFSRRVEEVVADHALGLTHHFHSAIGVGH